MIVFMFFNFPMFFYYYTILIFLILKWSKKRDSNSQHPTWKAGALPIELFLHLIKMIYRTNKLLENEVVETSSLRCKRNIIAVILIPHIIIVFPISQPVLLFYFYLEFKKWHSITFSNK